VKIFTRIIVSVDEAIQGIVGVSDGPGLRSCAAARQGDGGIKATGDGAVVDRAAPVLVSILVRTESIFALRERHRHLPLGVRRAAEVGVGRAVEGINMQSNLRRAAHACPEQSRRVEHGHGYRYCSLDRRCNATRDAAVVPGAGPELRPVLIHAEPILTLRQGQCDLAARVRRSAVVSVGDAVEGVDVQPGLRHIVAVADGYHDRNRRLDRRSRAARNGTVVFRPAPELGPILIRPEAIAALRERERHLTAGIRLPAEVGIGCAVERIDIQTNFRRSTGIQDGYNNRDRRRDRGNRAARNGAVVFGGAPELRPVFIRPEAVFAARQGEDRLALGIGFRAETCVGRTVEGVHGQTRFQRFARIRHRHGHRDGGEDVHGVAARHRAVVLRAGPVLGSVFIYPEAVTALRLPPAEHYHSLLLFEC